MTGKKKKKKTPNKKGKYPGRIKKFLADERVRLVAGIFFILFALYLFMALISYLFTWQADQSFEFQEVFSTPDIKVENWAGKTGAFLSHIFIYKWFGLSAFIFPAFLLLLGLHILDIKPYPLGKAFRLSIMGVILLSLSLGYLAGEDTLFLGNGPGGGHGLVISLWLRSFMGSFGTGLLILFLDFSFILFTWKPSSRWFMELFRKKETKQANTVEKKEEITKEVLNSAAGPEITRVEASAEDLEITEVKPPDTDRETTKAEPELTVSKKTEEESSEIKPLDDNYDPTLDLAGYNPPGLDLLEEYQGGETRVSKEELINNKNRIVETLENYKISIDKIKATIGPTITLYEIVPSAGVRISKIKNLEDDIALSLSALGIRIIAPIPGKGTIGIEVPNQHAEIVSMRSMISSARFQETKYELPIALGKTISNESYILDLTKMPHLLVAGATGQGKSVGLNVIIASLLYKKHPAELKFVFIDPKKVELSIFSKIERHFLAKLPDVEEAIITDTDEVINTLNSLNVEMDDRYELLKKAQVRKITEYNTKFIKRRLNPDKGHRYLPYIVLVIDEFADLIMTAGKGIEMPLARLAQKARAVGIHLVIATQRPTTNIITGTIKANFPARIAFRVTSMVDSRTILDSPGANQLIGRGDMLINDGGELERLQCAFIDTPELDSITEYIGSQRGYASAFLLPEYSGDESGNEGGEMDPQDKDSMFDDAARVVVLHQQGSTSLIQRKLSVGYNRAGRLIDQLEGAGIVGPFEGSKARKVLISDEYALEQFLNDIAKEGETDSR